MNKLVAMEAFCLVCEYKNFSQAARKLNLSPTMVSRYVKQLENAMGCLLLKRDTRRVTVTEAGDLYWRQISPLLKKVDKIERLMGHYHQEPRGKLTLSASIELGSQYLARLIGIYQQKYPQVELDIRLSNAPVDLIDGNIDLAFRVAPRLPDASYIARAVCQSKLALWCNPEYLLQHGEPQCLSELSQHTLLFFSHSLRPDSWLFQQNGQREQMKLSWNWQSDNGRLLNEAAALGQGIIQAPAYSVAQYVKQGQLIELLPQHSITDITVHAVYQHRYELSVRIKTFVEEAIQYFNEHPLP